MVKKTSGTGFQPVQSFTITRRNLPHWQQPGGVYFITWRCRADQILAPAEKTITLDTIRYWDNRKWTVYAAVVMSNHVHILAQPLSRADGQVINLGEIIHSVKSFSALKINQHRGSQGSVWQDERHDRIVRHEAEFLEKWQYIRLNPVKQGLVTKQEDYPWLYERAWECTGKMPVPLE